MALHTPPKAAAFRDGLRSLDLEMNDDDDDERDSPALLSARNSALSLCEELFMDEDDQDTPKSIDSADMPQLRYSIGTSGDRRHLHRDIHCAHKGVFGGLDLNRQLQARKAAASTGSPIGAMLCRIPVVKPALMRSKSAAWARIPSLLTLGKRKSEPPESVRAAVEAGSKAHESPPKPRKTVSFADVRDARSAASSRASSVASAEYDSDDADEQGEAQPLFDEQSASPAAPAVHADEWASWAFQPADAAAFGMEQQMMLVPVMGPHGPQMVYMDQAQMAAMMYQQQMEYIDQQHMAAVEQQQMAEFYADPALYAPVPIMPQMAPPQMGWAMPQQMPQMQQMPPQMAAWQQQMPQMPTQMPPQMPTQMPPPHAYGSPPHAAAPMPMAAPPATASPPTRGGGRAAAPAPPGRTRGALLSAAKEQQGSRRLQSDLARMSDAQLESACAELAPHLLELSMHQFGNYVVSKLAGRPQAQPHLVAALRGHVVELLQHAQGSRVVQATINALPQAEKAALVGELDGHVFQCALDTHGSWGVCVAFKATHAPFIVAQMARNMAALATQQHGIRVVQQVLNEAAACGMDVGAPVAALLEGELAFVAQHAYGNYAVQAALRHAAPAQREAMLAALLPRLDTLSRSKHGSNVAEMVLMRASAGQLELKRAQIFGPDHPEQLREMMSSPFGNYVLQALLRRLEPSLHAAALARIEAETSASNFGRAIIAAAA